MMKKLKFRLLVGLLAGLFAANAWAIGIFPALLGGGSAPFILSSWDGTESGATDDTAIWFFDNGSAGANELGQGGGLSVSDLLLTQAGNVAAATGTPPYRTIDQTDDYFTFTSDALNTFFRNRNVWTLMLKLEGMATSSGPAEEYVFALQADAGAEDFMAFMLPGVTTLSITIDTAGINTTIGDLPGAGIIYICVWSDGTYVRAGWKDTTMPTKWSDFPVGQRTTATSSAVAWTTATPATRALFAYPPGATTIGTKAYWTILSTACLIVND